MIPAIAKKGSSFKGAVTYITHDIGDNSDERVVFTRTLNIRTDDPEKAAKVMAWTAAHADELKQAADLPATGRKTTQPVYHFALSWDPSQSPTQDEMSSAAISAIKVLGFEGHEAVLTAHNDKDHAHIHVVLNRIHPETGRTANPKNDYKILQRWAWEYEKERGHIYCVDRALQFEKDPQARAQLLKRQAVERERGQAVDNKSRPQWDAERDAPFPKSKAAKDLRDQLGAQAKALHAETRAQKARHQDESKALWHAYSTQRAALWQRQRDQYQVELAKESQRHPALTYDPHRAERGAMATGHQGEWHALTARYQAEEQAAMGRLFQAQRNEFRSFLETSYRAGFLGALATAIQAAREAPDAGKQQGGVFATVGQAIALTLSQDKRATAFLAGQKAERDKLRKYIRAAQRPRWREESEELKERHKGERDALRERQDSERTGEPKPSPRSVVRSQQKAERDELRKGYVVEKQVLWDRHGQEKTTLKEKWKTLDELRRAAWSSYRSTHQDTNLERGVERGIPRHAHQPSNAFQQSR